jgi:peptidyl-prolyl cis-trans isomerase C
MPFRAISLAVIIFMLIIAGTQAAELNPVVGKAGDFVLREADLDRLISSQPPEVQKTLQEDPAQRINLVRQVLLTEAVAAKARSEGFDRKPEVREQVSYLIDQFLAQEYIGKVVAADVAVPEQELKKYYQEHEKDFLLPESVKARHIFIEAPQDAASDAKSKGRARAEELLTRLRKGEDFSKLAKEFSMDSETSAIGGELGWIAHGKTNSEEFEKALFDLKVGGTGEIVETPFGFHVVRVDERREKRSATFEETREYILNRLKGEIAQKKTQEFLDKVSRDTGLVVVGEKKGEKLPATSAQ